MKLKELRENQLSQLLYVEVNQCICAALQPEVYVVASLLGVNDRFEKAIFVVHVVVSMAREDVEEQPLFCIFLSERKGHLALSKYINSKYIFFACTLVNNWLWGLP